MIAPVPVWFNKFRMLVVKTIAEELQRRGHQTSMIEAHLNTVDGVWVGVWVMPVIKKGKVSKCLLRIGFGPIIEEHDATISPVVLADKVLSWVSLHREASLKRSNSKPVEEPVSNEG